MDERTVCDDKITASVSPQTTSSLTDILSGSKMDQQSLHIEVSGLWKVFGSRPERALQPEHASKSRDDIQEELGLVVGLRDLSFSVPRGQTFVVMGLSGSGKSTLARCLIRLIEATQGQIQFDGEDILSYSQEDLRQFRRDKIAMVFQNYALLPHRRVLDNVAYGLEVQGMDKDSRYQAAAEAIETVGLKGWEYYYPSEMSGGMQQRVGLARALAVNPEVLIMDEPFSGLDPLIRREMQDELVMLQSELQKTIIFITHDLDEALKLGDRIAIMRDGVIVQEGTPEEIVTRPANDYVSDFVQDVSRAKVIRAGSIMQEPDVIIHEGQDARAALEAMRDNQAEAAYIVGDGDILKGILTQNQVTDLANQRIEVLKAAQTEGLATTSPATFIESIIPLAAETERYIAVVDEEGRLLGEIDRRALLAGMVD